MADINKIEAKIIRSLAGRLRKGDGWINSAVLAMEFKLTPEDLRQIVGRLEDLGIISMICEDGTYELCNAAYRYISELDHRPPPNHWKKVQEWWRSKWWAIPVTLIAIGTQLLVQWGVVAWVYAWFNR